jgi:hypothetical protein
MPPKLSKTKLWASKMDYVHQEQDFFFFSQFFRFLGLLNNISKVFSFFLFSFFFFLFNFFVDELESNNSEIHEFEALF